MPVSADKEANQMKFLRVVYLLAILAVAAGIIFPWVAPEVGDKRMWDAIFAGGLVVLAVFVFGDINVKDKKR